MKYLTSSLLSICALSVFSTACVNKESPSAKSENKQSAKSNFVSLKSGKINQLIGDENNTFRVISASELKAQQVSGSILSVKSLEARKLLETLPTTNETVKSSKQAVNEAAADEQLLVGLPIGLLGEENIFGGVITKVSDKDNETLGTLKLTDLSPLHVRTMVANTEAGPAIVLIGCASECEESSQQMGLISFPIVGVDQEKMTVIVDLSPIGKELDLIAMMDPTGAYTQLKSISSSTIAMDYSHNALVFDIQNKMIPVDADPTKPDNKITQFTVRWYLKLTSAFNYAFESRQATEGVGFFKTERAKTSKITRFSAANYGKTIKYYIKNVPAEWKPVFQKAIENWNVEFKQIIGRDLLSFEFIDATDPRSEAIVAGDIRYNVMEWDLNNKAGYGGLGPSIANQMTGETISANVLIQGPTIVELYTKWFKLSENARNLMAEGRQAEADAMIAAFNKEAASEINSRKAKFSLKVAGLDMNVRAQTAELEDPMIKNHFELVPAGMTYEKYMTGYFTEMLEHELGHNLGLRHNFKGNLGAYESEDVGSVSRSIMEYLGRPFRYKSAIGLYDKMAIAYGYKGVAPKHLNWFCTDEDQGSDKASLAVKSAECTKSDATSDPFSFFEERLARAIHLLIDTKSASAPVWKLSEITAQTEEAITGLASYAASAEKTASTWTNFFGKGNRPETAAEVKDFVLSSIKKKVCNAKLAEIIKAKETPEASALAQANLDALKAHIEKKVATEWGIYSAEQLKCN